MMLASKIALVLLTVGLVALLAATMVSNDSSAARSLAEEPTPQNPFNNEDGYFEKPSHGLRHLESVTENSEDIVDPDGGEASIDDSSEPQARGNRIKGSRRSLCWYNCNPRPAPKPKPKPVPKYYYPPRPAPQPSCPRGSGVMYYSCSYCPCRYNERKFNIPGCGCGCQRSW